MNKYEIAVIQGDGIGPEVCSAAMDVLNEAVGGDRFDFVEYPAGAQHYVDSGQAFPNETFEGCKRADAILHGAAGLPGVTYPDGTEAGLDFGLNLRFRLNLYANIRPIKLHKGVLCPLRKFEPGAIDYVIVRENTEGLYSSRGGGTRVRDDLVTDTLVVTREGTERVVRKAFELAKARTGAPEDGKRRVTCCDKSNVLRSYAFFREVAISVAKDYPDIELDFALMDAMTVHLVNRPDYYDVIVTENMFGDILSDLGAATIGSMGMSPTAEVGDRHGFFQAAHGSAPDIAGRGIANPLGTILSAQMMLNWLGDRHGDDSLLTGAKRISRAVERVLASQEGLPYDLGGKGTTAEVAGNVKKSLNY
ncbi:MAG TPA: isocitrate/isopropylmalate dehydrogenase family protein [Gammaproteobacteria bacterium]|nr:isocitrate/isopropylmalate dehydrogenase family protein [Gammaproteobacteria bacterium]